MNAQKLISCPACGFLQTPNISYTDFALPPTGGDYEWLETDAMISCIRCQHGFRVRVQIDLETGSINKITIG
ncbi:MAG: hypothetical protein NW214_08830 [Pseudanabaenaceae cyanobacterium bins.39]|nr:hypothetical protein [Pseudanabaenaceae cyanobacterium bins.39]